MKRLVKFLPCLTAILLTPYLRAQDQVANTGIAAQTPAAVAHSAPNRAALAELAAFAAGVNPGPVTVPSAAADRGLDGRLRSEALDQAGYRAWKRSLIPLVATQALDIASSYGMRELNPALAGPDGRFGMRAVAIKGGATAAIVGVEYLLAKKYPRAARVMSKLNWSSSALTGAFAVHNFMIR